MNSLEAVALGGGLAIMCSNFDKEVSPSALVDCKVAASRDLEVEYTALVDGMVKVEFASLARRDDLLSFNLDQSISHSIRITPLLGYDIIIRDKESNEVLCIFESETMDKLNSMENAPVDIGITMHGTFVLNSGSITRTS